ncbi:DUF58 domain-containing protein [Fuerstiella marisgermanici]|uniref:VWFA domain-containing protein n=1 Tax=Fuerstiella marisgermanici TaxID=1891926 RepID=A0A1P8WNL0_9PLAN|nr:DUF58 domain-containing protein [Fuerstiella marisgermanici]APZ95642.1 hypothetical protein Fuma_05301 [Fuerstiella marisgermanici]
MPDPLPTNPTELARFGKLELIARQLVEGLMMGRHRSPFKGSSVEFVEHREYYPGDEIRHIDWRAYGKTGRYYIKEFEDETNLRAHLLVDASGSMSYSGSTLSKFDYARMLTAAVAWLLLGQRDSVGMVTFDSKLREQLRPSSNRDIFRQITHVLEETEPGKDTSLTSVIEEILPTIKRRSLLVLISDCFDGLDKLEPTLQRLRHARHEVIIFRIAAPEEIDFPFDRPTQFRNLEVADQRLLVDPARLRKEYLRQYAEFSDGLEKVCGMLGIEHRLIRTSDPLQEVLGGWLAERMALQASRR